MVQLDKTTFKIDKVNAKGMIEGFKKENKIIKTSIWTDSSARTRIPKKFPRLITLNNTIQKAYPPSNVFNQYEIDNFNIQYKYIATVDSTYHITNNPKLWEKICSNSLFDIWLPEAPFNRFCHPYCHQEESTFRIVLLRIYEINEYFNEQEIVKAGRYSHKIKRENLNVTIKRPVIEEAEFQRVKSLLKESIIDYQQ